MAQSDLNQDVVVAQQRREGTGDAYYYHQEGKPLHHQNCQDIVRQRGRKSVQFHEQVETISYEFDVKMRKHIWYRKTDYKRFHHEKKETLRHFRHAQSRFQRIQEDIFCLRGFEACLSHRAVQQRLLRKVAGLQAVLETQFDQRRKGLYDPQRIHTQYHRVTAPARNQALERAALDAAEVEEDLQQQQELEQQQNNTATTTAEDHEIATLKNQIDRLMHIKAGAVQTTLRSAASGPLMLRKSAVAANTA